MSSLKNSKERKPGKLPSQIVQSDLDNGTFTSDFEQELCWCIEQLELSIASNKLSSKQLEDSTKVLRTLKNFKAPVIKKRQMMRQTFGDYRKKMKDEERRFKLDTRNMKLSIVVDKSRSKFIKKHASSNNAKESVENQFKFNFPVPENNL